MRFGHRRARGAHCVNRDAAQGRLLGDSYSAGNGADFYYGPSGCYRSSRNWGEKYLDTLRTTRNVTFVNRACSGGVLPQLSAEREMEWWYAEVAVKGIVDKDDPRARQVLDDRGDCKTPYLGDEGYKVEAAKATTDGAMTNVIFKCTRYLEPQWDAVGKDTDLVMFSIGGNDVEFSAIVKQCFAAGFRDPGTCREKVSAAQARMPAVGDQLTAFLRRLKGKMRADARVVIKPYPYLEKDKDLSLTSWFGLGSDTYAVGKEVRALGDAGDRAQRTAIETVNAEGGTPISFLERVKPHFATHEPDGRACCDNDDRWLNEFGSTTMMEWYHYNPRGHTEIAKLLSENGDFGVGSPVTGGGSVDIAFVIDTTGSMGSAINSVKSAATDLVNRVSSRTTSARFALVDYRDFPSRTGASYDYPAKLHQDMTASATEINAAIQGLSLGYGGDWPETMYSGITRAFDLSWRPGVKKMVIVLADAPPLSPEPFTGLRGSDIIARSLAIDPVEVHYVDISGYTSSSDPEAAEIARRTNGGIYRSSPAQAAAQIASAINGSLDRPYAWAAGPYVGRIGDTFNLDGSGSYGIKSDIQKWEWDVDGDGTYDLVRETPQTPHTYSSAVTGLIGLRVTDADGRIGLATTIVNVSSDGDETRVDEDNCNDVANAGQEDYDADGIGDACDETPGWPTEDKEGISDSGADPDGNSSPGAVTTFRTPHFNLSSTIESANDRADYYGVQHRGRTLQVQLVDLPKDYDLVVTDRTGAVLLRSALEGTRNEKVRGELPAGRYLIGVVPKPGAFDDGEYTLNVTAVK